MTALNGAQADPFGDFMVRKHADELAQMWQGRLLAHTRRRPIGCVVLSVLCHSYASGMKTMLAAVFPGFSGVRTPFFCSAGKIAIGGEVVADLIDKQGRRIRNALVFKNEVEMEGAFRRLGDELKLSDADRIEMFKAVKKWIVCDWRAPVSGPELEDRLH